MSCLGLQSVFGEKNGTSCQHSQMRRFCIKAQIPGISGKAVNTGHAFFSQVPMTGAGEQLPSWDGAWLLQGFRGDSPCFLYLHPFLGPLTLRCLAVWLRQSSWIVSEGWVEGYCFLLKRRLACRCQCYSLNSTHTLLPPAGSTSPFSTFMSLFPPCHRLISTILVASIYMC